MQMPSKRKWKVLNNKIPAFRPPQGLPTETLRGQKYFCYRTILINPFISNIPGPSATI